MKKLQVSFTGYTLNLLAKHCIDIKQIHELHSAPWIGVVILYLIIT